MTEGDLYAGREQTKIKHVILARYLERFAHIVGMFWDTITYVDCFSGPWNVKSNDLKDSSFNIALNQLRMAKQDLAAHGRNLKLRCYFLERDPKAYDRLKRFAESQTDAEIETRNATLETSISEIVAFAKLGGPSSFPFIFVDPTGWTGFGLDVITPLLRMKPGEVLVNFMTGHILRFAEHDDPALQKSFDSLFGSVDYRARITGLTGQDREDELVQCYADALYTTGVFDYVCTALVLHPEKDRTHFHLIYATRDPKGIEVFKQVEKKAMEVMEKARADAQKRHRENKTGQPELFASDVLHDPDYYNSLRDRYVSAARRSVTDLLQRLTPVPYDDAWIAALRFPLVWESDLKQWIGEWLSSGCIRIDGLSKSDRVPKREEGHQLVWIGKTQVRP